MKHWKPKAPKMDLKTGKIVSTDWTPRKPTYEELQRALHQAKDEVLKVAELKSEVASLKQQLAAAEHRNGQMALELNSWKKKYELLSKPVTDEMLKRATSYLMKKELEEEQARIVKKLPMVKDVKTGRWVPKF